MTGKAKGIKGRNFKVVTVTQFTKLKRNGYFMDASKDLFDFLSTQVLLNVF